MPATDDLGNPIATPFPFAAAVPGLYAQYFYTVVPGRSVGYTSAITLNSPVTIRATNYTQQTSQAQRSLVSTSFNDSASGTGAQTVTINYLDNTMTLKQDTVTMNGITAVNTNATDIQFIESMVVATTGTNNANVGTINIMTQINGGGSAFASIAPGDNTTFYAHHYVPDGFNCYIVKHTGCGILASGRTYLVSTGDPRLTNLPILQIGDIISHLSGGSEDHEYIVPLVVPGPNLIIMKANPIVSALGNLEFSSMDWVQF